MKFARYLQDSQTPEWSKAYIDYRGLKKLIAPIQKAQQKHQEEIIKSVEEEHDRPRSRSVTPRPRSLTFEEPPDVAQRKHNRRISVKSDSHVVPPSFPGRGGVNRLSLRGILPGFKMRPLSHASNTVGSDTGRRAELLGALPLHELLTLLRPEEASFFAMLDAQLDKVEAFYIAREDEMIERGRLLQMQLNELNDHGLKVHTTQPWTSSIKSVIRSSLARNRTLSPDSLGSIRHSDTTYSTGQSLPTLVNILRFEPQSQIPSVAHSPTPTTRKRRDIDDDRPRGRILEVPKIENLLKRINKPSGAPDADRYSLAKRNLKKAVLEHYRGLELLQNYCIVNMTGFRKAVKKFEKVTKIQVQNQYMVEKVEKCEFASSRAVKDMMTEMEDKYANAFLKGDRKKATTRLRAGAGAPRTYHVSTFRAGMYLGLAVPALVDGLFKACQQSTREAIPGWSVLLFLYGVLLVPTLFSLLVGLNLAIWASARINYVFIFELEVLSRIDYRTYFEIPAILLASLVYTFWLCFAQIGAPPTQLPVPIKSTIWPLLWMAFAVGLIINPLPIMHRSSRFWFVRNFGRQFLSGMRPVEFTDFWMGDQLCSMTFMLSNVPTLVCVYVRQIQDRSFPTNLDATCGTSTIWAAQFVFASLPFVMRLAQSIKRYIDSRAPMHLVNAGKYLAGILSVFLYLYWRRDTANPRGPCFALWCVMNTLSSIYSCGWDVRMDWSLLAVHNTKHPFLRLDLIYTNISFYYIAIVTNILSRFAWVFYIPIQGPNMLLRAFIVGMLEMLRRWQWNFLRLENEHVGNVDQYRVTRQIPLPYPEINRDDDDIEDERRFKANVRRDYK